MKALFIIIIGYNMCFGERGDIVSTQILDTRSAISNQAYIDQELSQIVSNQFSIDPAEYGFWMYKVTYETVDAFGHYHIATGTIAYPRVDYPQIANQAFPIMSYQHGTVIERSSVSSVNGEWILPAVLTGSGYVYIEPDYLGLGDSEGMHPYQISEPYGTVVVDLLRATKQLANDTETFQINNQLFLAGYSEGGYATMAVHKIIERDYSDEFVITASFPMAGAYDMSGIMTDVMLSNSPYGEPFYFPYVLIAYIDSYPVIGSAIEYILSEYEFIIDMFDGFHSSGEINSSMPSIPITIMEPDSVISFEENYYHPLRVALRENDLWNWLPQAPMYIYHGLGDDIVPPENSQKAFDQFIENGAEEVYLEYIPESWGGHSEVAPFTLLGAFETAKEYAIVNDLGDLNQDGELNILDLVGLSNIILYTTDDNFALWASDVNMDNMINIQDIILVINFILQR